MSARGGTLVIHPGALGDVVLTIPALRALRAERPDEPLTLAAQPRLARLLMALGEVDRVLDFESLRLASLFTGEPCPARPLLEQMSRVVCWFGSREPSFVANLRAIAPCAVVAAPSAADVPVWQHLRRTVGAALDGGTRVLQVPRGVAEAGRRALLDLGSDGTHPVVLIHPGAGGVVKRWPIDGFATVARDVIQRRRSVTLTVHQGPADLQAASDLLAALGPVAMRLLEPPLETLAGILAGVSLYLGNDSGVSHLAAALGAPCVIPFTRELLGWRPWAAGVHLPVVSARALMPVDLDRVLAAAREAMP